MIIISTNNCNNTYKCKSFISKQFFNLSSQSCKLFFRQMLAQLRYQILAIGVCHFEMKIINKIVDAIQFDFHFLCQMSFRFSFLYFHFFSSLPWWFILKWKTHCTAFYSFLTIKSLRKLIFFVIYHFLFHIFSYVV